MAYLDLIMLYTIAIVACGIVQVVCSVVIVYNNLRIQRNMAELTRIQKRREELAAQPLTRGLACSVLRQGRKPNLAW
jgi:hypothetical protein